MPGIGSGRVRVERGSTPGSGEPMTDEQHVFDDIPEFDVVGDLQRQLSEARAEVAQLREALETALPILRGEGIYPKAVAQIEAVLHGRDPETTT